MIRRFMLLFVFLLAACNATPQATDTVFVTATVNPLFVPPPPAQSIAGTDVPSDLTDFAGGNPQILSHQSPFEFSVSGEVNTEVTTGSIAYNFIAATGALAAHDEVYISASDASSSQQISFQFFSGILAGEYPIVSSKVPVLERIAAQYGYLVDNGSGSELRIYADDISGTFTVTAVGDRLSGEFQFTAHRTADDGTVKAVEIKGSFSDVPYNTATDPFNVSVPLPTRDYSGTTEP